jgi:hypothetical protein
MDTSDKASPQEQRKKNSSTKISAKIGKVGRNAKISRNILKNVKSTKHLDSGKKVDLDVDIEEVERDFTAADMIIENSQITPEEPREYRHRNPFKKILFLSANPEGGGGLALDKEVREIEEGLQRAKQREQFDVRSKWAVRYKDLRRALMDYRPHIVHFAGHGEEKSLVVEGHLGLAEHVYTTVLAGLFEQCSDHVECVILNACYSAEHADAISEHINYVIGMPEKINDTAAIEFAVGFYDALGNGKCVEEAFKWGCNAILQVRGDLPEHLIPVLKKRQNI